MNARKVRMGERAALALLERVDEIHATRGRSVTRVDLRRGRPTRAELLKLLLGPSGNLRAPTVRRGRILVVGFDDATYTDLVRAR